MTCLRGLTALSALAVVSVKSVWVCRFLIIINSGTRYLLPKFGLMHVVHLTSRQKRPSPEVRIIHHYVYFVRASAIGPNIC